VAYRSCSRNADARSSRTAHWSCSSHADAHRSRVAPHALQRSVHPCSGRGFGVAR
jgi:hypothetical protein